MGATPVVWDHRYYARQLLVGLEPLLDPPPPPPPPPPPRGGGAASAAAAADAAPPPAAAGGRSTCAEPREPSTTAPQNRRLEKFRTPDNCNCQDSSSKKMRKINS